MVFQNLILISVENKELFDNYEKTVKKPLKLKNITNIPKRFKKTTLSVWGLNPTRENKELWKKIKNGDIVLFFRKDKFFSKGVIVFTLEDDEIPKTIWQKKLYGYSWKYMIFIRNLVTINIDFKSSIPFFIEPTMPSLFSYPIVLVDEKKIKKIISIFGSLNSAINTLSNISVNDGIDDENLINQIESNKIPLDVKIKIIKTLAKKRQGQNKFREIVLLNYAKKCAVCKIDFVDILEASHIIPVFKRVSGNIENGICLCSLHHIMFDKGYFSIDDNYKIILSENVKTNETLKLITPDGQFITNYKIPPSKKFLAFHRTRFGFE